MRFKLRMFQNSKIIRLLMLVLRFLALFSCVMHVVRCKQKEESFFFVTHIKARVRLDEYLTNWSSWQIDSGFSAKLLGGGRGGRSNSKKEIFRGGAFNQLKFLTDRSRFFREIARWWEGGRSKSKKEIFRGGDIGKFGQGGAGPKKNLQFEISRGWHLWYPTVEIVVFECLPLCINMQSNETKNLPHLHSTVIA